jgi:hypothetical protein
VLLTFLGCQFLKIARCKSNTPAKAFEAGSKSAFLYRIVGLSAQIFDNLVGREVEEL